MCELSHLRWGAYSAAVAAQTIEVRQIFHHRKSGVWPVVDGSREGQGNPSSPTPIVRNKTHAVQQSPTRLPRTRPRVRA